MAGVVLIFLTGVVGGAAPQEDAASITTSPFAEQLQTCREGVLDPQARPEERRRWIQLVFSYSDSAADDLVVELLRSDRADVQRAVCVEMSARGRGDPARLRPAFVEPLVALLETGGDDLRAAAARALAEFQTDDVALRLGKLVANPAAPLPVRLAAVSALTPNTHRREVVGQLVELLTLGVPEVSERIVSALEAVAPTGFGADAAKWREWWEEKKNVLQEQWLADQVRLYRERMRRLSNELAALQNERDRDSTAVLNRIRDLQREILRSLMAEHREVKLVEWIDDPLLVVKSAALSIVRSRIADEGKRPDGDLLAALLRLLRHEQAAVRRESLQIVETLQDRTVVEAVLAQLERETDPPTRLAMLDALGTLGDSVALAALVREVSTSNEPNAVRSAASSLAQIAARTPDNPELASAVEPLRKRYQQVAPDQVAVRAALLSAMAAVANPSFAADFLAGLQIDTPTILQAAIRGLLAIKNTTRLDRIRALTAHADPKVRLVAIEAIVGLGGDDADLEVLQSRLSSSTESNELVRQAAWNGWRQFLAKAPMEARIQAAERLRDLPDLEGEYLRDLIQMLVASGNHKDALEQTRERLVNLLMAAGRHADAVPYFRDLYDSYAARSDPDAIAVGLRWLEAVLQTPGQQGLAELIVRLCQAAPDETGRSKIVDAVRQYIDSPDISTDLDRTRRLLADLGTVDPQLVGDGWSGVMNTLGERVKSASGASPAG